MKMLNYKTGANHAKGYSDKYSGARASAQYRNEGHKSHRGEKQ